MKLESIVLTGFKSFAKREKIKLRDGILAVVGPNGCGKSNIVDALRWTMGESRASQLRQEVSADIIFNGAAGNRPADWCSVELNLSNDGSRDLGMWGEYDQLSVRRQVERDGKSDYFINGQRVRRRDVHDLFAGTGSGSRSYGIVEQERVTQVVRADPQLIRSHLEEVAGVAIYKSRRRETETKITVAEANIARLEDQMGQLDKQLSQLKRQAATTFKIRQIKQQLDQLEILSLMMRHDSLKREHGQARQAVADATTRHAGVRDQIGAQERKLAATRKERQQAAETSNRHQGVCYGAQADVERAQQALADFDTHTQRLRAELGEQEEKLAAHVASERQLGQTRTELASRSDKLAKERAAAATRQATSATRLGKLTATGREQREQLNDAEQRLAAATKAEHELRSSSDLHSHRIADHASSIAAVEHDLAKLAAAREPDEKGLEAKRKQAEAAAQAAIKAERARQAKEAELADAKADLLLIQGQIGGLTGELDLLRRVSGQLKQENAAWFAEHGEKDAKRFLDAVGISAPGLEKAVDAAFGAMLEGFMVSNLDAATADGTIPDGLVLLGEQELAVREANPNVALKLPPLAGRVKTDKRWQQAVAGMLSGIYLADDHASARAAAPRLRAGERIVTPAGETYLPGMVMAARSSRVGVAWRAKLDATASRLAELEQQEGQLQGSVASLAAELGQLDERTAALAKQREQIQTSYSELEQRTLQLRHEASYQRQQKQRLTATLEQLVAGKAEHAKALGEDKARLGEAQKTLTRAQQEVAKLKAHASKVFDELEQLREQSDVDTKTLQEIQVEISVTAERLRDTGLRQEEVAKLQAEAKEGISERKRQLEGRSSSELAARLASAKQALAKAEKELARVEEAGAKLERAITTFEAKLHELRGEQERETETLRELEQTATAKRTEAEIVGKSLGGRKLESAEHERLRAEHPSEDAVNSRIDGLRRRIERAGPINYAAESELAACEDRRAEVGGKSDELKTALAALKDAIRRIDAEMLGRLKEVHAKLNVRFDALFKQLFGGGRASLELDGDDLLAAGLSLRVTPPGKRVTNIQSLSGGEKTLTALAFLFALNELNPMPFCVLDEVDAALDDTNTAHYCRLIESMKERTQFILITHNKQVIEKADWLLGVTQEERGVTKMVTVNLDQALAQVKPSPAAEGKAVA